MNRPSQLTRLIWDFYRENKQELQRLKPLAQCRVHRCWKVLYIRCSDPEVATAVVAERALLEAPVAQLRLAQKIRIFVNKNQIAEFKVNSIVIPRLKKL